jgi:murein DD-endopeptidase MepM/ murein hydrolase activator NlpD
VFIEGKTGQVVIRTNRATQLTGRFLDQDLRVISINDNTEHFIFVGIPIFTQTGMYPISLSVNDGSDFPVQIEAEIQIVGGTYGSERINLLDGRDDLLNANVENAELDLLRNAVASFTPERYFTQAMGLPAAAAITSGFGTRRSYNGGEFNRFHSGTDFAGAPGSAILAPAPGRVVLRDSLNVRGNATMIDHGWGIYTGYWHQTEIYVNLGDFVDTGQVIGTIGSTGRVTGAHLHWELWVNGVPVDPMQWVQQSFLTFLSTSDV